MLSATFKNTAAYETDQLGQADYVWRIVLMLGAVPALLTYYWRMKMPETARYTALIAKNHKLAASDMATVLAIAFVSAADADALVKQEHSDIDAPDDEELALRIAIEWRGWTRDGSSSSVASAASANIPCRWIRRRRSSAR